MPWDWPVEVNFHEAKAYCNWKGPEYRVITEAEWHRIRDTSDSSDVNEDVVYDNIQERANIQMKYGTSTPVNMFPPSKSGYLSFSSLSLKSCSTNYLSSFYDVHGNVWEWAEGKRYWCSFLFYVFLFIFCNIICILRLLLWSTWFRNALSV